MNDESRMPPGGKSGGAKRISMELTGNDATVTRLTLVGSRLSLTIEADICESQILAEAPRETSSQRESSPTGQWTAPSGGNSQPLDDIMGGSIPGSAVESETAGVTDSVLPKQSRVRHTTSRYAAKTPVPISIDTASIPKSDVDSAMENTRRQSDSGKEYAPVSGQVAVEYAPSSPNVPFSFLDLKASDFIGDIPPPSGSGLPRQDAKIVEKGRSQEDRLTISPIPVPGFGADDDLAPFPPVAPQPIPVPSPASGSGLSLSPAPELSPSAGISPAAAPSPIPAPFPASGSGLSLSPAPGLSPSAGISPAAAPLEKQHSPTGYSSLSLEGDQFSADTLPPADIENPAPGPALPLGSDSDFGGFSLSLGGDQFSADTLPPADIENPAPGPELPLGPDPALEGFSLSLGGDQFSADSLPPASFDNVAPDQASSLRSGSDFGSSLLREAVRPMTGDLPSPIAEQAVDSGFTFQKPVDADIRKDDNKKPQAGFSGWPETTSDDGSSILGGARHGEPQPSLSFSFEPTPPVSPPPSSPAEKPQHHSAPEAKKPVETGNTTVLIRYTCPKCKTQGMQEVDKVGAVVNCSNCGKAMRLVMKK